MTPEQIFQDVPADHAFKTMTMEPFPHSGMMLASVHPCKHASVMKKFIDRMDTQQQQQQSESQGGEAKPAGGQSSGGKWGIRGMVRKVTGGSGSAATAGKDTGAGQGQEGEAPKGVQVDFYLVIVGSPCAWRMENR